MSTILKKIFNPLQRISKAKFMGAPSLVTAEDLNRQIDIIDYRNTLSELAVPIVSTLDVVISVEGGNGRVYTINRPTVSIDYSQIKNVSVIISKGKVLTKGCEFTLPTISAVLACRLNQHITIGLYAKKTLLSSDDDITKEISGARFLNGMTYSAASHYIYRGEELVIQLGDLPTTKDDKELVAVLGKIRHEMRNTPLLSGDNQTTITFGVVYDSYCILPRDYPNFQAMIHNTTIPYFGSKGMVVPGDSLAVAFQKVTNLLAELFEAKERILQVSSVNDTGTFEVTIFQRGGWIWMDIKVNRAITTEKSGDKIAMTSAEIQVPAPYNSPLVIIGGGRDADDVMIVTKNDTSIEIKVDLLVRAGRDSTLSIATKFTTSYPYKIS